MKPVVCQGYDCNVVASPDNKTAQMVNDPNSIVIGWFCSDDCWYHPLSSFALKT